MKYSDDYTLAHELGHLLTNEGHHPKLWNLMVKESNIRVEDVKLNPLSPKRLTEEQGNKIRRDKHVK